MEHERDQNKVSRSWKESPCPVLRPLDQRYQGAIPFKELTEYLREIGVRGWFVHPFIIHVRRVATGNGLSPGDLSRSLVLDTVFTGITRSGTNHEAIEAVFGLLDADGETGNRLIGIRDLARLAALLRVAFPKKSLLGIRREVAINMTIIEWVFLIRCFGEQVDGALKLRESVYRELVDGRMPTGEFNRDLRWYHPNYGIWQAFKSRFIRLERDSKVLAQRTIGRVCAADKTL